MKIKDLHSDIERYLAQDCYCPNEIYGTDGFGYRLYYANDDCIKFVETDNFVTCITEYYFGEKFTEDHFSKDWDKDLKCLLSISDAIMID